MNVAIIGTGNLAHNLAYAVSQSPHTLVCVIGRNLAKANELASKYHVAASDDFNSAQQADIIIIAVSDDSIQSVAANISSSHAIIIHTSGSVDLNVLSYRFEKCAVLYPFQTFSAFNPVLLHEVPVFIEAADEQVLKTITGFAGSLSSKVFFADSQQRKWIHLSGVFASNYTNHCLTISENLIRKAGFNFDILKPLITSTFQKALLYGPYDSQTGPALRNDKNILTIHSDMLRNFGLSELYNFLAGNIQKYHQKE